MNQATVTAGRPPRRTAWQVQRDVLFALVQREMKARVGGQWVGAVWTLFEPLAHVVLMVGILGGLRGAFMPGIEYPVFLAVGLVPFFLFQNLVFRLMDGIDSNRGLFSYRQVKPFDTLVSRAIVESLMNLAVYALTLGVMGWAGLHVLPRQPLEMLCVNGLIILFGTAFGMFAAVITHDRPRARSLLRLLMFPLYLSSGVIFPVDLLPREYLDILLWNPMLHLVELSRASFIAAYTPADGINALYPTLAMLCFGALGMLLYRARRQELISS
jgi:capsular polysaccharide transport system permease protein